MCSKNFWRAHTIVSALPALLLVCVSSRSTCRHVSALWAHLMGDHIRPIYVCSIVEWVITSLHILQEVIFLEDPRLVGAIAAGRHDRKWRVIKGGWGAIILRRTLPSCYHLRKEREMFFISTRYYYHHFILFIQVAFHTQVTSAWCSNKQHAKIRRSFAPLLPAKCYVCVVYPLMKKCDLCV